MLKDDHKTKRMGSALKFPTRYAVQSGSRAQRFPLVSSPKETSHWEKFDDDDEVQKEVMTWFKEQAAHF